MRSSHQLVSTLIHTAKKGNKKEFVDLLNKSNIFKHNQPVLNPKEISLMIYSFANLKITEKVYWNNFEKYFLEKKSLLNQVDIMHCVWGFSKVRNAHKLNEMTWKYLEEGVLQNVSTFNAKQMSLIAYSFAQSNRGSKILWLKIKESVLTLNSTLNGFDLSILVYAFATIKESDDRIWSIFEKITLSLLEKLEPQSFATTIHSFAKMEKGSDQFWQSLENNLRIKIHTFPPRALSHTMWGFAKRKKCNDEIWDILCRFMIEKIDDFNVIDFVNSVWSLHKAKKLPKNFQKYLEKYCSKSGIYEKMYLQDVLNLAWVIENEKINTDVFQHLTNRLKYFISQKNQPFSFKTLKCFLKKNDKLWREWVEKLCIENITDYMKSESDDEKINLDRLENVIAMIQHAQFHKCGSTHFYNISHKYVNSHDHLFKNISRKAFTLLYHTYSRLYPEDREFWPSVANIMNQNMLLKVLEDETDFVIVLHSATISRIDRKFIELVGNNISIIKITKAHIIDFIRILLKSQKKKLSQDGLKKNKIEGDFENLSYQEQKEFGEYIILNIICSVKKEQPFKVDKFDSYMSKITTEGDEESVDKIYELADREEFHEDIDQIAVDEAKNDLL